MKKYTPVLVLGVVLLFFGITASPIVADNHKEDTVTISFVEEDTVLSTQTLVLTATDLKELDNMLSELLEQIQSAPDYDTALSIIEDYMMKCNRNPKLSTLFSFLMKTMFNPREFYSFSPFMQNVVVMSSGYTNNIFSVRGTRIHMHRFLLFWFYSSNSNLLVSSITSIMDPYPFSIKTMTGRQVGLLRGFTGVYITQHSNMANKDYTYFMGHARCVLGYDFSR